MTNLRVSVVIPTHNRSHLLHRSLSSAITDIEGDDEIIVVDDGSSDTTEEVVRKFEDPRIRYIRQAHLGAGAARNRGTSEAKHELVAYLDSDDEWIPGKTALQRRFLATRGDVLFCFSNFATQCGGIRSDRDIDNWHRSTLLPGQSYDRAWDQIMGAPTQYSAAAELPSGVADFSVYIGDMYYDEMHTNYILTSSLMVRASAKSNRNWFSTTVRTYEDWECFGWLAKWGLGSFLDYETTIRHRHPGPQLTDADDLTCIDSRIAVLNNVWGSDAKFLKIHGDQYEALLRELVLLKVRCLLAMARRDEALDAMRCLDETPLKYRILGTLPLPMLKMLLITRRCMKGGFRSYGVSTDEVGRRV
jgi:glycosyltransferase involved in cell wall biosynthesis